MDYEYEYGRYKKKVEDQQKQIAELQEQIEGMQQVLDANNAIIAAMLVDTCSNKHDPFTVKKDTISKALQGGYGIVSEYAAERGEYDMWYTVPESE